MTPIQEAREAPDRASRDLEIPIPPEKDGIAPWPMPSRLYSVRHKIEGGLVARCQVWRRAMASVCQRRSAERSWYLGSPPSRMEVS
jgi:hypothetical protein